MGDLFEQRVARGVAHRIVHRLEFVDIDEKHRGHVVPLAGTFDAAASRSLSSVRFGRPVGRSCSVSWAKLGFAAKCSGEHVVPFGHVLHGDDVHRSSPCSTVTTVRCASRRDPSGAQVNRIERVRGVSIEPAQRIRHALHVSGRAEVVGAHGEECSRVYPYASTAA